MAVNAVGRDIPEKIGNRILKPYAGEFASSPSPVYIQTMRTQGKIQPEESKLLPDITTAIKASGLKDGMTISFHHHFRDGDYIILQVLDAIAKLGIKNLTLAPSSLTDVHDPVVELIKKGVVSRIETSALRGKLGKAVSEGILAEPVILRTHGDRLRAMQTGELKIDVAFLSVSQCDDYGNANCCKGKNICGSMGYAIGDSKYANKVVLITEDIFPFPCNPASINQTDVDYIVKVDAIGDSDLIGKGAARITRDPKQLKVAQNAAKVIEASGLFVNGFSVQTGVGAVSIAVTQFLRERMLVRNIKAGFALGGISAATTKLHEEGLIDKIMAVQSYDVIASAAVGIDPDHIETDVGVYANMFNKGPVVNKLDIAILSALEIDTNYNCNIITGSNGEIRGALGGGPDSSAAAKLTLMVIPLIRGRMPSIVDEVNTICTPGTTVDAVVTEYGVSVNPNRPDLYELLKKAGIKIFTMQELKAMAEKLTGKPKPILYNKDRIIALVEYRDGTIIDVIYQLNTKDQEK
jgi:citrate lyase subunit alpha/citrate CoA-transferase